MSSADIPAPRDDRRRGVRVEATQIRTPDDGYAWIICIYDTVVEMIVRNGAPQRLDYTEVPPTRRRSSATEQHIGRIVAELEADEDEVAILTSYLTVPREVYRRVVAADEATRSAGLNEIFAYVGKNIKEVAL